MNAVSLTVIDSTSHLLTHWGVYKSWSVCVDCDLVLLHLLRYGPLSVRTGVSDRSNANVHSEWVRPLTANFDALYAPAPGNPAKRKRKKTPVEQDPLCQ